MRLNRPQPQSHHHSPSESSYPPNPTSKRHSHDLGYPTSDYPTSVWRTQNLPNSQQQIHAQLKHNSGTNDLSRHSATRQTERNSR